jgi:hypothetical protein
VCCLLTLVIVPFDVQKLLNLMQSHLSILALNFPGDWSPIKKIMAYVCVFKCFPIVFAELQVYIKIFDPF